LFIYARDTLLVASERTPLENKNQRGKEKEKVHTCQCPFSTSRKTSIESTCSSIDSGQGIAIFSPKLSVVRPEGI
jgi:hypothetical protein